ncbi:MAG: hypothetical protein OEY11_12880 [Gammaproteobacteria bacterium]|nr:hypothetical protein [Gammaproteobacteria bacterium]
MKLQNARQDLEEYFAKHYTKKYTELGGYYYIKAYKDLSKSPMQKYFSSGKYEELKDDKLEGYWQEVKRHEFKWNVFVAVVIVVFYLLAYEF